MVFSLGPTGKKGKHVEKTQGYEKSHSVHRSGWRESFCAQIRVASQNGFQWVWIPWHDVHGAPSHLGGTVNKKKFTPPISLPVQMKVATPSIAKNKKTFLQRSPLVLGVYLPFRVPFGIPIVNCHRLNRYCSLFRSGHVKAASNPVPVNPSCNQEQPGLCQLLQTADLSTIVRSCWN